MFMKGDWVGSETLLPSHAMDILLGMRLLLKSEHGTRCPFLFRVMVDFDR